jgi:predicted phosphodiesterase
MPDPTLTRRGLLGSAALAAASQVPGLDALAAAPAGPVLGPALEPELVTVTDTAMVAWWRTDEPADTTVRLTPLDGPDAGRARDVRLEDRATVHVARVDGLVPGTRYAYELRSGGRRVSLGLGEADPGEFRTLVPPAGRRLATIGVLNDLHVGEHCSGTITDVPGLGSVPPCNSDADHPDYAHRMVAAAIDELRALRLDLVIANGDLTDRGRDGDVRRALAQLARVGAPVLVTRGNHDRRLAGECAPDGDCLRAQAFPGQAVGDAALTSVVRVGDRLAVVGLDSADPETGKGRLDLSDQPAWLDAQLTALRAEGRDALVAFHHPVLPETDPPSPSDVVDQGAGDVLAVLGRHEHVRMVLHGHTHRNNLGYHDPIGPRLPFLENGAVKEYPAGYALLHVHEDGIMRTFHRPVNAWTREWTTVSATQVYGLHPNITRGPLSSRAFVTSYRGTPPQTAAPSAASRPRVRVAFTADRNVRARTLLTRGLALDVRVDRQVTLRIRVVAGRVVLASGTRRVQAGTYRLRVKARTRLQRRMVRALERRVGARIEVTAAKRTVRRTVRVKP